VNEIPIDVLLGKLGIAEQCTNRRCRHIGNIGRSKHPTETTNGSATPGTKTLNSKRKGNPSEINTNNSMNLCQVSDLDDDDRRNVAPDDQFPLQLQQQCCSHSSIMSSSGTSGVISHTNSYSNKQSCSICLENFNVGDAVSWSTSDKCSHVFHHTCIREWLLRKVGCPYCREVVLPVDRQILPPDGRQQDHTSSTSSSQQQQQRRRRPLTDDQLCKFAGERGYRATTTYFCVDCGLIPLQGYGEDHWKTIQEQYRKRERARTRTFKSGGGRGSSIRRTWKRLLYQNQNQRTAVGRRRRWQQGESDTDVEGRRENTPPDSIDNEHNASNSGIGNTPISPFFRGSSSSTTITRSNATRTTMSGDLSYHHYQQQEMMIVTNDTMDEDDDEHSDDQTTDSR
jgi:hypothetical protein